MGRRGPKPKSAAANELDNPSRRPIKDPGEIEYLERLPTSPQDLGEYGELLWRQVCGTLLGRQMLSSVDLVGIEIYCRAYQEWREADDDIAENGYSGTTDKGYEYPRPSVKRRAEAAKTLREWSSRFGLSPLDRAGVELPIRRETPPSSDPLEDSLPSKPKGPPVQPPAAAKTKAKPKRGGK